MYMYMFPKESFCYSCHNKCCAINCSNCWRSYCQNCAIKNEKSDQNSLLLIKKCSQCDHLEQSAERWKEGVEFPVLKEKEIMSLFDGVIGELDKVPKILKQDSSYLMKKINPVHTPFSLNDIRKKVKNLSYRCPEEMAIDIKIVEHILLTSPKGNFDQKQLREASEYLKYAVKKLRLIDECPNCVLNFQRECSRGNLKERGPYFLTPCSWPHALVLVEAEDCKMWPAKVLYYSSRKRKVRVSLFGSHGRGWINQQSIFYARDPRHFPNDYKQISKDISRSNTRIKFDIAVRELKFHIKRLEKQFPDQIKLTSQPEKPWLPSDSLHLIDPKAIKKCKEDETKCDEMAKLLSPQYQHSCVINTCTRAEASSTFSSKSQLIVAMNSDHLNRGSSKRVKITQENCFHPQDDSGPQQTVFETPDSSNEILSSSQSDSIADSEFSSQSGKSSIGSNGTENLSIFNMPPGEERDAIEAELKIRALHEAGDLFIGVERLDDDVFWPKYHLLDTTLAMNGYKVTSQDLEIFQDNSISVDEEKCDSSKFIGNSSTIDDSSDFESLPNDFRRV